MSPPSDLFPSPARARDSGGADDARRGQGEPWWSRFALQPGEAKVGHHGTHAPRLRSGSSVSMMLPASSRGAPHGWCAAWSASATWRAIGSAWSGAGGRCGGGVRQRLAGEELHGPMSPGAFRRAVWPRRRCGRRSGGDLAASWISRLKRSTARVSRAASVRTVFGRRARAVEIAPVDLALPPRAMKRATCSVGDDVAGRERRARREGRSGHQGRAGPARYRR